VPWSKQPYIRFLRPPTHSDQTRAAGGYTDGATKRSCTLHNGAGGVGIGAHLPLPAAANYRSEGRAQS
jgi:hypothetical protein